MATQIQANTINPKQHSLPLPPKYHPASLQSLHSKSLRNPPSHRWRWTLCLLLCVLIVAASVVCYLTLGPMNPQWSIDKVWVKGLGQATTFTSTSVQNYASMPELHIAMKIHNPSKLCGIHYQNDNTVIVQYVAVRICSGLVPSVYQPPRNVTTMQAHLSACSNPVVPLRIRQALMADINKGRIPLKLVMVSAINFKMGAIRTGTSLLKVSCDFALDGLTPDPKLISSQCHVVQK